MHSLRGILLLLAISGAMGAVFDIYNTLGGAHAKTRFLRPIFDLLFWLASAFVVYYAVFVTNDGQLRFYMFAVLLTGYLLYRLTLHRRVVNTAYVVVRVVSAMMAMLRWLLRALLLRPLHMVWEAIVRLSLWVYRLLMGLENVTFWIIGFWLKVITFPVRRPLRTMHPYWARFLIGWEEIWERLSNWIKVESDDIH